MSTLTIKHITTYRYKKPVAFGEHRMMLRPLSSDDQSVIAAELKITPTPTSIREIQDAFGNHVNIARFAGRAKELRFESAVRVKHTQADIRDFQIEEFARTYPFNYRAQELLALARYMQRNPMDVDRQVDEWARTVVSKESATDTRELLINLTHRINGGFKHVRRDEKGIQTPRADARTRKRQLSRSCDADDRRSAESRDSRAVCLGISAHSERGRRKLCRRRQYACVGSSAFARSWLGRFRSFKWNYRQPRSRAGGSGA